MMFVRLFQNDIYPKGTMLGFFSLNNSVYQNHAILLFS